MLHFYAYVYAISKSLLKNAQLMETDTFMTLKLLCCYLEFVFVIMRMPQPIYKG